MTAAELEILVVLDTSDDDRKPYELAEAVKRALELCSEVVIYVEDLPTGTRILSPAEPGESR